MLFRSLGLDGSGNGTDAGGHDVSSFDGLSSTEALAAAVRAGGRNFIAHPHAARIALRRCKPVNWVNWQTQDFCGLEIWSYLHDICDYTIPWGAPLLMWVPKWLVRGPRKETLRIWDQLTQQRPVAGIAALDNHARRMFLGSIVPHRHAFRALRTHVICDQLPEDATAAEAAIIEALCAGSAWSAMDQWADSRGFRSEVTTADGRCIALGQQADFTEGMTLTVRSPRRADLAVIRNGDLLEMRRDSDGFDLPLRQAGVYRVEAHLRRRAWVLTNPIYLNR